MSPAPRNPNTFRFKAKVWRYPGPAGWFFVNTGKKVAADIRFLHSRQMNGWGQVKVQVKIGRTRWETSLFPAKGKDYLLAIKAPVRKAEGISGGDAVQVEITIEDGLEK